MSDVWAVVPVKDTRFSKQRLAGAFSAGVRQRLAIAMFADVLDVLCWCDGLAGILVVTEDSAIASVAAGRGARVVTEGATEGHTGAVMGGARVLAREGRGGMLALPGDVPLVSREEIGSLLAAHGDAPSFTIVAAHDGRGSNAVVMSPPDLMALRFGGDSFVPHVSAAERLGVVVRELRLPGIGLDIDEPADVARFLAMPSNTRARAVLLES